MVCGVTVIESGLSAEWQWSFPLTTPGKDLANKSDEPLFKPIVIAEVVLSVLLLLSIAVIIIVYSQHVRRSRTWNKSRRQLGAEKREPEQGMTTCPYQPLPPKEGGAHETRLTEETSPKCDHPVETRVVVHGSTSQQTLRSNETSTKSNTFFAEQSSFTISSGCDQHDGQATIGDGLNQLPFAVCSTRDTAPSCCTLSEPSYKHDKEQCDSRPPYLSNALPGQMGTNNSCYSCEEKRLINSNLFLDGEEEGTLLVSIDQPVEEPCPTVDLREDPDLRAMPEASTSALASPLGLYKPSQFEPPLENLVTLWQPSSAMDEVEQVLPEQNDGYEYDVESPHEYYQSLGTDSSENMYDSSLNLPAGAFVPESVYNYLDKQLWVKLVLSSGGKMEVMVKGISEAEARADILQNTALQEHQLTVATFVSSTFRYL